MRPQRQASVDLQAWLEQELVVNRPPPPAGILTGFPTVDRLLGGLERGSITALLGAQEIGKTSLALQWELEAARHTAVLHISLREDATELCQRFLMQSSNLSASEHAVGLQISARKHLWHSLRCSLKIEDGRRWGPCDLINTIRQHSSIAHEKGEPLGLVVIDGFDAITSDLVPAAAALESLACELDVAIVVTAKEMLVPAPVTSGHMNDYLQEDPNTYTFIDPPAQEDERFAWLCHADVVYALRPFEEHFVGPRLERYRLLQFGSTEIQHCHVLLRIERKTGRVQEERYLTACGNTCVDVPNNEADEWDNCDQIAARAEFVIEDEPASGMLTPSEIAWLQADKKRLAAEAKAAWAQVLSRQAHG